MYKEYTDCLSYIDCLHIYDHVETVLVYGQRVDSPEISVMIPTYNRQEYLIQSVQSALQQHTNLTYEIVVIDNSEQINTAFVEWLREIGTDRVCYYHNVQNIGMFGNWNRCISLAQAPWLVILNDDDLILQDYIEKMGRWALQKPKAAFIGCSKVIVDENGCTKCQKKKLRRRIYEKYMENKLLEVKFQDMYYRNIQSMGGALINREIAVVAGGFSEQHYPLADATFMLKLLAAGEKIYVYPSDLFAYRIAVNESFNPSTLLDFVCGAADTTNEIHRKHRFLPDFLAKWHRDCTVLNYEHTVMKNFPSHDNQSLIKRFAELNQEKAIGNRSNISREIHERLMRLYVIKINYIRKQIAGSKKE